MKDHELNVVGAICARGGSKGVPRKNIRPLLGKPLIAYTIECAKACPDLSRVVVSTDDIEIADIARMYHADVPFMRPFHLAQDESSKWDVFIHLVETLEKMDNRRIDVLVDLDVGVPLRKPEDISQCIQQLVQSGADVVVTAYEPERNPYFNMVEVGQDGLARISKPMHPPITRRQAAPAVYGLSPAVYAVRRDALWQYNHWSQSSMRICLIPRDRAVDIDSELDFEFVAYLMSLQRK